MPHARTLVTAALPYANGPIHLGHLAGAYLPADLICRYARLKGRDVVFVCGSDELGAAIVMRAVAEGVDRGKITRAVAWLRSGNDAVVRRGLAELQRLDAEHATATKD